jgi:sensor histidine kinase regulating citrate/malate metabolism
MAYKLTEMYVIMMIALLVTLLGTTFFYKAIIKATFEIKW